VRAPDAYVNRQRSHRLVRVDEDRHTALVCEAGYGLDIETASVAVAHLRDRDDGGPVVDGAGEPVQRERVVRFSADMDDLRPATFLRVPDLPDRRELQAGRDHRVSLAEVERGSNRIDTGRRRRSYRDGVRFGVENLGKGGACAFGLAYPMSPWR